MQGSHPLNRPVRLQDDPFTNTDVQGGLGGGLKFGIFPAFTGRHCRVGGRTLRPRRKRGCAHGTTGGVTRSATFRLQSINAMANLLLRYPGEVIQPYIGIGAGLSGGFARDLNLQSSTIGVIRENAADGAFAYQFIGGIRANVSDRLFLFTEYKYFVANYQWESEFPNGCAWPILHIQLSYPSHLWRTRVPVLTPPHVLLSPVRFAEHASRSSFCRAGISGPCLTVPSSLLRFDGFEVEPLVVSRTDRHALAVQ